MKRTGHFDDYLYLCFKGMEITSWKDYENAGGLEGLSNAVKLTSQEIIEELLASDYSEQTLEGKSFAQLFWPLSQERRREDLELVINIPSIGEKDFVSLEVLKENIFSFIEGLFILSMASEIKKVTFSLPGHYDDELGLLDKCQQLIKKQGLEEISFDLHRRKYSGCYLRDFEVQDSLSSDGLIKTTHEIEDQHMVVDYLTVMAATWIIRFGSGAFKTQHLVNKEPPQLLYLQLNAEQGQIAEIKSGTSLVEVVQGLTGPLDNFTPIGVVFNHFLGKALSYEEMMTLSVSKKELLEAGVFLSYGHIRVIDRKFDLRQHLKNTCQEILENRNFLHFMESVFLHNFSTWLECNSLCLYDEVEQSHQASQLYAILHPTLERKSVSSTYLFARFIESCFSHFSDYLLPTGGSRHEVM